MENPSVHGKETQSTALMAGRRATNVPCVPGFCEYRCDFLGVIQT